MLITLLIENFNLSRYTLDFYKNLSKNHKKKNYI